MTVGNPLIGGRPLPSQDVHLSDGIGVSPSRLAPDGTEWAVAILVLGALGVLVLFRWAGFQAVIAASVGK